MDPRMMNAWLAGQAQKAQISPADMQRRRLGIVPNAAAKTKSGLHATAAGTSNLRENNYNYELSDLAKKRVENGLKIIDNVNSKLRYPSNNNSPSRDINIDEYIRSLPNQTEDGLAEILKRVPQPKPGLLGALGLNEQGTLNPRNPRQGKTPMSPLASGTQSGPGYAAEMVPVPPHNKYYSEEEFLQYNEPTITPEAAERLRRLGYTREQTPPLIVRDRDQSLNEQLNSEEEAYARKHKHMLSSMIDQYGKEKGTKVFYATVRNKVRGR